MTSINSKIDMSYYLLIYALYIQGIKYIRRDLIGIKIEDETF